MPEEFMGASIIYLYNPLFVTSIGASLYCLFARVLLNRLNEHLDQTGILTDILKSGCIEEGQRDNRYGLYLRTAPT